MEFELTPLLVDEIIFAMENQTEDSFLDTETGAIIGLSEEKAEEDGLDRTDAERYIELPEWSSMDGFRLMEAFVSSLRNPILRDHLSSALASGRGVFRAFKNVIKEYPEAEKLWFVFKDREMKKAVHRWYNTLRESWGLERIGEEPEETGELVISDFLFRPAEATDAETIEELGRAAFIEIHPDLPESLTEALYERKLRNRVATLDLVAETGTGEFAAFVEGETTDLPGGAKLLTITDLAVRAEYRGLGVGEAILERFLELAREESLYALIEISEVSKSFAPVAERLGFAPLSTLYLKKP